MIVTLLLVLKSNNITMLPNVECCLQFIPWLSGWFEFEFDPDSLIPNSLIPNSLTPDSSNACNKCK